MLVGELGSDNNLMTMDKIMALTAHAFLFTIALAGDSTPLSRYLSMLLSIIITILTCRLFIGHMIREVADRHWLEEFEKAYLPDIGQVHIKVRALNVQIIQNH